MDSHELELSCCNEDEGVLLIADGCPELAEISLSGCYKVTDASIIALGKSCHQLISIDLERCFTTDEGRKGIFIAARQL